MTTTPPAPPDRHVLVVAGGDLPDRTVLDAAWPGWDDGVVDVIAADGGLAGCDALGLRATVLVGDLDSADADAARRAAAAGVRIVRADADKDESDTELAAREAVRGGATRVTLLGALGGARLDHALANVWLLAHSALASTSFVILDAATRLSLVTAPDDRGAPVVRSLPGPIGAIVSLLPLGGDVAGVTTHGLRYPLDDEPLAMGPARGLSNIRTDEDASVTVGRGRLLVVEIAPSRAGLSSVP